MRAIQVLFKKAQQQKVADWGDSLAKFFYGVGSTDTEKAKRIAEANISEQKRITEKAQGNPNKIINTQKFDSSGVNADQMAAADRAKEEIAKQKLIALKKINRLRSNPANSTVIEKAISSSANPPDVDEFIKNNPQEALSYLKGIPMLPGAYDFSDAAALVGSGAASSLGGLARVATEATSKYPELQPKPAPIKAPPFPEALPVAGAVNSLNIGNNPLNALATTVVNSQPQMQKNYTGKENSGNFFTRTPAANAAPQLRTDAVATDKNLHGGMGSLSYGTSNTDPMVRPAPETPAPRADSTPPPAKTPPSSPWYKNTAVLGGAGLMGVGGLAALLHYYNSRKKKKRNYDQILEDEYNQG